MTTDRREFLTTLSLPLLHKLDPGTRYRRWQRLTTSTNPFSLGVASGDPSIDGFVLWTRLAPTPLDGGGMPPESVAVRWEVATDEAMSQVVRRGAATAVPTLAHSVHVEVSGLHADRWYWYRFIAMGETSPVGRARTMPMPTAPLGGFAFAVASCQNYEHGYYTALRHLANEDLDLVAHLGDYIYEYGPQPGGVRKHLTPEIVSLADYRLRYALYKLDPDLQAAHAAVPWAVTWDDHEVDNNYVSGFPELVDETPGFLARRAAAYQAFYEHQPIRLGTRPVGPNARLYRVLDVGRLARFQVLDTRQYRADQSCGDRDKPPCPERLDPRRSVLGATQERWFKTTFAAGHPAWNIVAQQIFFARNDRAPGPAEVYNMDSWNGYPGARQRVLDLIAERGAGNTVVLTGDVHSSWASDLHHNPDDPTSPWLGAELVATSLSSGGNGADSYPGVPEMLAENPHIKYFNGHRGYIRCRCDATRLQADFRVVANVTTPGGEVVTHRSFLLEAGTPGLRPT